MAAVTRKKIIVVLIVVLALGIFLPPNINGARFSKRLASALSTSLGRQVKIGSVKYRLFPRPGFDLYNFQVMDDPAFSNEPLLLCGKVTADLRLTSLWQGRLEIANLKLTDDNAPPSLNLVYSAGHWNLESLLLRVEQVPTDPTAKRSAGQRARFPYIEASAGRINVKVGPEKKPYALINTDFAFWLASEGTWHVRLEGHPVRTDMNLNDTGTVKLEGDLKRAANLLDIPVKLQVSWQKAPLGQFSSLVAGQDKGWRGILNGSAQLAGPLRDLQITATADLNNLRRYDINRDNMPQLGTRCLGEYKQAVLDLKCDTELETGGLVLTGQIYPGTQSYDLSLTATRVPLSMLATLARHTLHSLPDDLTATGDIPNAAFAFHCHAGVRDWHGTGVSAPFLLQTSVVDKPFPVSRVRFHVGQADTPASLVAQQTKSGQPTAAFEPNALTVDSFSVQLGPSATLEVQGNLNGKGYWMGAKGMVPLERLLALGRASGFQSKIANTTASAQIDLNISGPWVNFAPPKVHGTAHLQNVATWISGLKDRMVLTEADAQLTDTTVSLTHITGQFEHSPIAFTGSVTSPIGCGEEPCPLQFDLHLDSLRLADVAGVLGVGDKSWTLPFLSNSGNKLPDFRAAGTLSIGELKLEEIPLEKVTAHVEMANHGLLISHAAAKTAGGSTSGDWKIDWSTDTPRYTGAGKLDAVFLERWPAQPDSLTALLASWVNGKSDMKYSTHFEGKTSVEMLSSASGRVEFTVTNGTSRALLLEASKPLKFQSAQGEVELDHGILEVQASKFKAETRIYVMSGSVSLANKQAKLKMSNNGSQWEITGAVDKPQIVAQPITAQAAPAHTR